MQLIGHHLIVRRPFFYVMKCSWCAQHMTSALADRLATRKTIIDYSAISMTDDEKFVLTQVECRCEDFTWSVTLIKIFWDGFGKIVAW